MHFKKTKKQKKTEDIVRTRLHVFDISAHPDDCFQSFMVCWCKSHRQSKISTNNDQGYCVFLIQNLLWLWSFYMWM